ncbi:MAG: Sec-independent protein translocase protein TatB [Pseudomonadota bacterium]
MIDFGFDKIALIGAVALIVIGPEKLPRVARTVGHMLGKAQRYVADVKAEVNRSIELDELKKMKTEFEGAARDVEQSVNREVSAATSELQNSWDNGLPPLSSTSADASADLAPPPPDYKNPKKNWRLKRGAMPAWYKQRQGIRTKALSGAARVARFRPKPLGR